MKRSLVALLVVAACSAWAQRVPWAAQTVSVPSSRAGDPTFLFVPGAGPGLRLIVGTDTVTPPGAVLFPLGATPAFLQGGAAESADSRGDVLVTTSPGTNSVSVYRFSSTGVASSFDTGNFFVASAGQVALGSRPDGGFDLWVDTSSTQLEHSAMSLTAIGTASFTRLRTVTVPELPSGLALDDRTGRLYVGQPSRGIVTVERDGGSSFLVSIDAGQLGSVVGGLDLFLAADGGALVFSAAPNEGQIKVHAHAGAQATFLTSLELGDVDGGTATVTSPGFVDLFEQAVPGFPRGVMVVQDDGNGSYKLVSLAAVNEVFTLPPAFMPGMVVDAGAPADAGLSDAGTDGGVTDAGVVDAGVTDGGSGGGNGGGNSRPPDTAAPLTPSCGCTGGPFTLLPALFVLWCLRRRGFALTRP